MSVPSRPNAAIVLASDTELVKIRDNGYHKKSTRFGTGCFIPNVPNNPALLHIHFGPLRACATSRDLGR